MEIKKKQNDMLFRDREMTEDITAACNRPDIIPVQKSGAIRAFNVHKNDNAWGSERWERQQMRKQNRSALCDCYLPAEVVRSSPSQFLCR